MPTQLSAGVIVTEQDFSGTVPVVSTSVGGIAGVFKWGPVGERTYIESEAELLERFWRPTDFNAETWFSAANFLAYGAPLWVVRAANTTSANAEVAAYNALGKKGAANVVQQVVRNETDFYNKQGTFDEDVLFLAKYPGDLGNSLRVSAVYTPDEFANTINLTSYGFVTTDFESGGGVFSINTNTRDATITITANSVTTANTLAQNLVARFQKYDIIRVGDSNIGQKFLTIKTNTFNNANNDLTGNSTIGTAVVRFRFFDKYKKAAAWTSTSIERRWEFADLISVAPGTSAYVQANGNDSAKDELHLVVVDEKGKFSGVPGTILEVFKNVSRANDAVGLDRGSIFYTKVINEQSRYIWAVNDRAEAPSANAADILNSTTTEPFYVNFVSGSDGADEDNIDFAELAAGWDYFVSPEDVDVSLLVTGKSRGGENGTQHMTYILENIAEVRKDCVVFGSPEQGDVVNNYGDEAVDIIAFRDSMPSSSYGFLDSGYKYQYDRYNNVFRWIPLNGDIAGLAARTDATNDPWWAIAGFNRGQIKNLIKLAYNPSKPDRDLLYQKSVNPVVSFPASGTILYGQKTLLNIESAFNRLNVRRLFIVMEKAIARLARQYLFEFNDAFTRQMFKATCDPYMRDIQSRRGLTAFLIKCDENNNTPQVIDTNRFVAQFFVKPNRVAEFIELQFFAVGTAIQFTEIEGRGL